MTCMYVHVYLCTYVADLYDNIVSCEAEESKNIYEHNMNIDTHSKDSIYTHAVEKHAQEEQKPMSKFEMRRLGLDKDHPI